MMRMIPILASALLWASVASATTLTIVPDKALYQFGETITLSIFGDAEGAIANTIYGRLLFSGCAADIGSQSQQPMGPGWIAGTLTSNDTGCNPGVSYVEVFNQIHLSSGSQTATNPIATVTLIARLDSPDPFELQWDTSIAFQLDFFGLTSAPGTSVTIEEFVPEPASGALLALGVLIFAFARRST